MLEFQKENDILNVVNSVVLAVGTIRWVLSILCLSTGSSNNSHAKESYLSDFGRLEVEVELVLEYLRKSQENEYNLAEERLNEHKRYLQSLYQQLAFEKSELANEAHSSRSDALFHDAAVGERVEQIRREVKKFEEMKKVAQGFGSTPKNILEHFGL